MGSRNKIQADFLRELADHFAERGREAIERLCNEEPAAYIKVVASLIPKDQHVSASPLQAMSDDDLLAAVSAIKRYIEAGSPPLVGETIDVDLPALPALPDGRR